MKLQKWYCEQQSNFETRIDKKKSAQQTFQYNEAIVVSFFLSVLALLASIVNTKAQ